MELTTLDRNSVSCLGLANQYLRESTCVATAFEASINYFFFYNLPSKEYLDELKPLLAAQREVLFIATGSEHRNVEALNRYFDQVCQSLRIEVVDAFFVEYLSPKDKESDIRTILDELYSWKEKGRIRYVGVSTHNRAIALSLIESHQCDVLMHRYNMAHRKAEVDILPAARQADIPVVAFTCTRWSTLLEKPANWSDAPPTAADCYRFALHNPAVRVALTAPTTKAELESNLSVLHAPPLTPQELARWQQYGDLVYGSGQDAFETQWP